MNASASDWDPDAFATQFERRADGTLFLEPLGKLNPFPERLADSLEHWARVTPDRVLVARRDAGGRWIESQLFGVRGNDPLVLVGAALALAVVALAAGGLPARRASRLDPMAALRHE